MRTTVDLPDDILEIARSYAAAHGATVSVALAELVRRGLKPIESLDQDALFPRFRVPAGAQPLTMEQVRAAEDEL